MAEQLATAEGDLIDLEHTEQEFAAAMAAPAAGEPEAPAPPDVGTDPDAPFGRKIDGQPKKGRGGRPPKEPSRTQAAPRALSAPQKAGKPGGDPGAARDYSEGLSGFTEVVWLALAGLPIGREPLRTRCRVQAAVLKTDQAGLVSGVNIMAQHNGVVRWGVEKLATGDAAWIFPAALALMPFAVQTSMLWRTELNGDMAKIADRTEEEFAEVFASILHSMGEEDDQAAA